jgi:ABC-2 type transport system permease protein
MTVFVDSWTMTRRNLAHWAGQPGQVIVGLLFPVMVVLMFGYLFGGRFGADYREFLLPGMFAMTMLFGLETTFAAVATDAARGVTDRFRSMPISGSAVVAGRAAADLLYAAAGLAVMVACGYAVGWRFHGGTGAALLAFGLLLLLRFGLLWVGIWLGLVAPGPEAVVAVQILVWPLGFLSNVFASPDTMPAWLGAVASWNPLSATVSATRDLFGNPGGHPTVLAVVWPVALTVVFFVLSVRRYRRLSR